jgi:hypothetical protein
MGSECQLKENQEKCTCPHKECERYGACCVCVSYHRSIGDLPKCLNKK